MANIHLRNIPDDVHQRLKDEAAQDGKSLNEYLVGRLTEIAARPTLAQLAARTKARGPVEGITMADIVEAVHEGRPGG